MILSMDPTSKHHSDAVTQLIVKRYSGQGRLWDVYEGILYVPSKEEIVDFGFHMDLDTSSSFSSTSSDGSKSGLSSELFTYHNMCPTIPDSDSSDSNKQITPSTSHRSTELSPVPVVVKFFYPSIHLGNGLAYDNSISTEGYTQEQAIKAAENEARLYVGPLRPLWNNVVMQCFGLWTGRVKCSRESESENNLWALVLGRADSAVGDHYESISARPIPYK